MKQKKKIKKRKPLSTETRKKISEALRARKKKDAPIVEPVLKSQEHTDELLEKYKDLTRQEIIKLQRIREHRQSNGSEYFKPFDYQENFLDYIVAGKKVALIQGANQIGKCVTSQTLIDTPSGELLMGKLFEKNKPFDVYAWDGNKKVIAKASTPFKKEGLHKCYRITMSDDRWVEAADYHRVFCSDGSWQTVQSLYESFQHHRESTLGICPSNPALNVKRSFEKRSNYPGDYSAGFHQYGEQPHFVQDNGQVSFPSQDDVRKHNVLEFREDVRGSRYINTALPSFFPLSNLDVLRHFWVRFVETLFRIFDNILSPFSLGCQLSPILSTVVISGLPQGFLIDQFVPQKKFSFSDSLAYCPPLSDGNKIISITPISPCQEVYDFEVEKYHNYFAGGLIHHNTLIGSILIDTFANCRQAFDWKDKALEKVFENRPVRIRIIASDWEHHANEVIVPKLKEVITAGTYTTRKNNVGVEAFWQFKTGSTIELMTHSQETKLHEGWTGDVVWSDEPLPQDKFVANRRGLIAHSGLFFMTMTAISEPWIMDEIVLSNKKHIGCVTNIPMRANKTLTEDDIRMFEEDIPASQRTARVQGGWLQLIGRILKEYDKDKHIIDAFDIMTDWPVTPFIDIHLNKPQAISFYAVDKHGNHYVIDEIWEHYSPEEIADEIIKRKLQKSWDIDTAFIDPLSKGDSAYVKNRGLQIEDSFTIIGNKLANHQIQLLAASKDKKSGILNLSSWLLGVNKRPTLFFFDSLPSYDGAYGHLYEIVRWIYDKEGIPTKENDHFMENLYRYTLAGIEYTEKKGNYCYQNQPGTVSHSASWMGN